MGGSSSPLPKPIAKSIDAVADTVVSVVKNPLPTIETIALTSAGVPAPVASAAVTYANGGSTKDAVKAGVISYASQQAVEAYAPAAQAPDNVDVGGGYNPATGTGDVGTATAAVTPSPVEKSAVGSGTSAATRTALSGGSLKDVLKAGAVGAAAGAGGEAASGYAGYEPGSVGSYLTKQTVKGTITNLLSPQQTTSTYQPTSVTTTGAGASPGSSALGQALRTDLGAPVFGGDKDKESPKSGWNIESLRYAGGTGEA